MTPRNLSLANLDNPPDLSGAAGTDTDCTTATAEAIRVWLLGCRSLGTLTGLPYVSTPLGTSLDAYFREAGWLSRALVAWNRVAAEVNAADRALIQAWLLEQAAYMQVMLDTQLLTRWAGRETDDYTIRTGFHLTEPGKDSGFITRQGGVMIPRMALNYNNRRFCMVMAIWLAGEYFGIESMKVSAKRYVREWLMFSVFPNGDQGEWSRADEYGFPEQGFVYASNNLGIAFEVASRAAALGDRSLLEFSSRDGAYTTVSPSLDKTLFLPLKLWFDVLYGVERFVTPAGNVVQTHKMSGQNQRRMHWSFMLMPLARIGMASIAAKQLAVSTPAGWAEDFGEPAWAGVFGMYGLDIRAGVSAPALAFA